MKTTQRFLEAHLLKKFSTEPYPKPLCKIMKNALLFDKKRKKIFFYFLVCFLALCRFHPPSVIIVSFCFFSVIRLCMGEMNIKFVACPHTRCLAISYQWNSGLIIEIWGCPKPLCRFHPPSVLIVSFYRKVHIITWKSDHSKKSSLQRNTNHK